MHRSMKKRGLPVQSMLLFKFFYQGEGEDTANIVAWLGFTKGTAENLATRVLARRCTLEFKSFLAENGHDIPCFAHEVEVTPAGYSFLPWRGHFEFKMAITGDPRRLRDGAACKHFLFDPRLIPRPQEPTTQRREPWALDGARRQARQEIRRHLPARFGPRFEFDEPRNEPGF